MLYSELIYAVTERVKEVMSINFPRFALALAYAEIRKNYLGIRSFREQIERIFYPGMCKCKRECCLTIPPLSKQATPRIDLIPSLSIISFTLISAIIG